MPKFTIESSYSLPIFRHRTYDATTFEEACRMAIEDDDWERSGEDYESSGSTYLTGAWKGEGSAYTGEAIPVPPSYAGTIAAELPALRKCLAAMERVGLSEAHRLRGVIERLGGGQST
ncbi:hypothetical protein [Mesorhizobium sp.]|uniref:hypothetical protein n=1 Tax=Mesorhizobium sp. TaxID=1871066 RepID=UPI0011F80A68|nr:hypothetical protein [Mesorhizobium sp.]TIX28853.1 MAG: hypothetical protein E5V35_00395 [Mesorhizobium sp.]